MIDRRTAINAAVTAGALAFGLTSATALKLVQGGDTLQSWVALIPRGEAIQLGALLAHGTSPRDLAAIENETCKRCATATPSKSALDALIADDFRADHTVSIGGYLFSVMEAGLFHRAFLDAAR